MANKKYRAILIDTPNQKIKEVTVEENNLAEAISCEWIETGARLKNGDVIYVDEEGLMKPNCRFKVLGMQNPLSGKGLVIGVDRNSGETVDAKSSELDIALLVTGFDTTLRQILH